MTTELILQPKQLRFEDLPFLAELGHVDGDNFLFDHSPKGYKLKTPTRVPLARILAGWPARPCGIHRAQLDLGTPAPNPIHPGESVAH